MTHLLLFPLWRACFRVVLDGGGILVPGPATVQCGQRYDRKADSSPWCQMVEYSKKTQKVMLKYILENEKTAPNFEQKWQKTGLDKFAEKSK